MMKEPTESGGPDASQAPDPSTEGPGPRGDLSRRGFLQAVGLGATAASLPAAGLLGRTVSPVRRDGENLGPDSVPVTLVVNGETLRMRLEPRVTLLDALRNHMQLDTQDAVDLTGAKRVCDRSSCGACSVQIDGKLVYACSVLAIEAQGSEITTVEGLGEKGSLSPVQEEFVSCDGLQCGFCTPGFVMASTALLAANASPSDSEARRGLSGNICRCGTQTRVLEAVNKAAARMREGR
ncbi:MAG: (2Fe-2S)-binding protein [Planctomycetota bacterium]|nr:(2Fe-2S)-binding protein [Planctomycetota bacterium]